MIMETLSAITAFVKLAQSVGPYSNIGTSNSVHNLETDIPDI